ncbi:MAG: hypothetical protein R3B93_02560 [Bacteroidia bacterium]
MQISPSSLTSAPGGRKGIGSIPNGIFAIQQRKNAKHIPTAQKSGNVEEMFVFLPTLGLCKKVAVCSGVLHTSQRQMQFLHPSLRRMHNSLIPFQPLIRINRVFFFFFKNIINSKTILVESIFV